MVSLEYLFILLSFQKKKKNNAIDNGHLFFSPFLLTIMCLKDENDFITFFSINVLLLLLLLTCKTAIYYGDCVWLVKSDTVFCL